jgi:hypothetical protein
VVVGAVRARHENKYGSGWLRTSRNSSSELALVLLRVVRFGRRPLHSSIADMHRVASIASISIRWASTRPRAHALHLPRVIKTSLPAESNYNNYKATQTSFVQKFHAVYNFYVKYLIFS